MPQMLNAEELLDYSIERGARIYEQGCKALDDKALTDSILMTTNQTVVFVEAFSHNKGTKLITPLANCAGTLVDLIMCYEQINKVSLKTACERFCKAGEVDAQGPAKQNNTMMAICLASSLTTFEHRTIIALHHLPSPHLPPNGHQLHLHSTIPKNPVTCRFLMATILWGTPWPPRGHRVPIF
jgi:hypothetical protein